MSFGILRPRRDKTNNAPSDLSLVLGNLNKSDLPSTMALEFESRDARLEKLDEEIEGAEARGKSLALTAADAATRISRAIS